MPSDIEGLLKSLGTNGVWAVIAWRVCVFLGPHVSSITQAHVALVKTLRRTLRKQAETQQHHGKLLNEIHQAVVTDAGVNSHADQAHSDQRGGALAEAR